MVTLKKILKRTLVHLSLQKNVHSLQSSVDSLQKEKEELILALQSAKKDTNQAKYEHSDFLAAVDVLVLN